MLAQKLLILAFAFKSLAADQSMMKEKVSRGLRPCKGPAYRNIARNMPASKSSSFDCNPCSDCSASKAVDGDNEGVYSPYCTTSVTAREENAWWEVDLVHDSIVSAVVLYNNVDKCSYCLHDYDILLKDSNHSVMRTIAEVEGGLKIMSYLVKPIAVGVRYVRVQLHHSDYLLLSEVEVYGLNELYAERNLARNKLTSQSSTADDDCPPAAWKAVDGHNEGVFYPWCTVSQTNPDNKEAPWWEVDLTEPYVVTSVEVFNRIDCCMEDLANFNITLLNSARKALFTHHFAGRTKTALYAHKLKAALHKVNFVRVHFLKPGTLALAEVKVWGYKVHRPQPREKEDDV